MSSTSSSLTSRSETGRRIYVTGYSSKEDSHDMKKIFKRYGKIEEFSWKGKYFFIVNFYIFKEMIIQLKKIDL